MLSSDKIFSILGVTLLDLQADFTAFTIGLQLQSIKKCSTVSVNLSQCVHLSESKTLIIAR